MGVSKGILTILLLVEPSTLGKFSKRIGIHRIQEARTIFNAKCFKYLNVISSITRIYCHQPQWFSVR